MASVKSSVNAWQWPFDPGTIRKLRPALGARIRIEGPCNPGEDGFVSISAVYSGSELTRFSEAFDIYPEEVCWKSEECVESPPTGVWAAQPTYSSGFADFDDAPETARTNCCELLPDLPPLDSALKYDDGKPPHELLPFEALESVSAVLAYGAKKYAAHNWRKGLGRARLCGAALRHVFSYLRGVDNDPESGLPHLAHAACCILFALTFHLEGTHDDRRSNRN